MQEIPNCSIYHLRVEPTHCGQPPSTSKLVFSDQHSHLPSLITGICKQGILLPCVESYRSTVSALTLLSYILRQILDGYL